MQKSNTMRKPELVSPACFGKSVLLIDPDIVNHQLHRIIFEKYKVNLQCSKSLRHGIWLVQENPPDLILTEILFNGHLNLEHIFLLKQEKNVPIIVQTCQFSELYEDNCKIRGADAYFTKPLHWELYLKAIERCLVKG